MVSGHIHTQRRTETLPLKMACRVKKHTIKDLSRLEGREQDDVLVPWVEEERA